LVAKYSDDADSKPRGGDLTQFDRSTKDLPKQVVAAAFALTDVGDIADLISTDKGFVVLKLTDHRPALSRSLDEARSEIQRRLLDDLRSRRKKEYVDEARRTFHVEINEEALAKLELASVPPGQSHAIDAGNMVGTRP
jgi:parvulin-like peptidyl-prolyl isomerase